MTRAAVKIANRMRKDAYVKQRALRAKVSAALDKVRGGADPRKLFAAWSSAEQDRRAFLAWLAVQRQSVKDMRVVRTMNYLLRNANLLGGMNPYMDNLARTMAQAAVAAGVFSGSRAIARGLASEVRSVLGGGNATT